jgi:uncharacterized membrane protein
MSTEQHTTPAEEIDLGYFFRGISNFFRGIARLIFMMINFFKRKIIWIVLLIITGVVLGYFKDNMSSPMYQNRLIVVPNFESVDYLYEKIEEINLKRKNGDSLFIQQFTGGNWKRFAKIEIEALPDIYNFVTKNREQLDAFRILFENQELSDFLEDDMTSHSFKYHKLNFFVGGSGAQDVVEKMMAFINDNDFYKGYQEVYQKNTRKSIEEAGDMVEQIGAVMDAFSYVPQGPDANQAVMVNSNSDMMDVAEYQQLLLKDKLALEKQLLDQTQIIRVASAHYNIIKKGIFSFSRKIQYPILLVLLFSLAFFVRYLFNSLKKFAEHNA